MSVKYKVVMRDHINDNDIIIKDFDNDQYKILDATITQTINTADVFTFTIYPDNPNYREVIGYTKRLMYIYCENSYRTTATKLVWVGQIASTTVDINLKKSVTCKGALSFLDDTSADADDLYNDAKDLIKTVLEYHKKQLALGNAADARYVYEKIITLKDFKSSSYLGDNQTLETSHEQTALDAIMDNVIDNFGGYLTITYQDAKDPMDGGTEEAVFLNYYQAPTTVTNQEIIFGDNMIDFSYSEEFNSMTRLMPLGGVIKGKEDLPDNRLHTSDETYFVRGANTYGVKTKCKIWNEISDEQKLYDAFVSYRKYMLDKVNLTKATVTALDKGVLNQTYMQFAIGDLVHIYSKPHGFAEDLQITGIKFRLDKPTTKTLTLGDINQSTMASIAKDIYTKSRTKATANLAETGLMRNIIKQIGKSNNSQ